MAIYYNILYPPVLPLTHPAFELTKPEDTFRLFFEPSVGNRISDFAGGFIRIRSAETEKTALLPVGEGYLNNFIPFRNPFAERVDILNHENDIKQPDGYEKTIPYVQQDKEGSYYIDIKQEAFTLSGANIDIKYKAQIMLTTDWVSSTLPNGRGYIQVYADEKYVNIDQNTYFGGNLVAKGLSEWSSNSLIAPVSEANYELQIPGNSIFSPIFEFVGTTIKDGLRNNSASNYLKAYRIEIYSLNGDEKDEFVDSSDWIIGQEPTNLEIRWQNAVELQDKKDYLIELSIQTEWDLRKVFQYKITTAFEDSLFQGDVTVENDHDYARAKIKLNIKTPLQWGPKDNFEISINDRDYAHVNGEGSILEGIDFYNSQAAIAGEMIISDIDPIRTWEDKADRWFFKLAGPTISTINPYQEEYCIYAHCAPRGKEKDSELGPYEDDIIINPVIQSPDGEIYATWLDSSRLPFNREPGAVVTMKTDRLPSSHTFFFLSDPEDFLWRVTVNIKGEFISEPSHKKDPTEFLKPVCFWDSYTNTLVYPRVDTDGQIWLDNIYENYSVGDNVRPAYTNEFRFVKKVYALELGRKVLLHTQTYKAFLIDFNQKLNKWAKISKTRKYYIYFASLGGQLRLIVRDLTAGEGQNSLDRFTLTYSEGLMDQTGQNADMFLITTGLNKDFETIMDAEGNEKRYVITSDERGALGAELGFISSPTTRSRDLKASDIQDLIDRGVLEE